MGPITNCVLKLCNVSTISCLSTTFARRNIRVSSVLVSQHFPHKQDCKQPVLVKKSGPTGYFLASSKQIKSYCSGDVPSRKSSDQVENILTIPNILTVSRMVMCPVLGYLVIKHDYSTALGLFVIAGITDLVFLIWLQNSHFNHWSLLLFTVGWMDCQDISKSVLTRWKLPGPDGR